MVLAWIVAALSFQVATSLGHPARTRWTRAEPDPSFAVKVKLGGKTYINKGLVAFGLIPSNFTESTGDTLGGIGSAIALKRGSFSQNVDGTFKGTFVTQPDRGFNVDGTIDWQGRQHQIDFVLTPYYDSGKLDFDDALNTLKLTYRDTLLYTERNAQKTTGLDALAVRPAQALSGNITIADPALPVAATNKHLSLDAEGLVLNADGTFWVSDEYGPYIYLFGPQGDLVETLQPPNAILPFIDGQLNFTSETDPDTGRAGNQGFEGLTADSTGRTLYALLQSATIQDGGTDKSTSRYTRLVAFDISDPLLARPPIVGEWVVPLPQNKKGNTLAASELHFVSNNVFLVLSRDGDGHGGDDNNSAYKQADLLDISNATDIHGTKFDDPTNPIAKKGTLVKDITPGIYESFVSFIDDTQLARFGLHNGKPADQTLIDAKWESLALAPCFDADFPDDFFLFTAADNDFISTQGISLGQPFDAGLDVDNQFMVFRVTLPGATTSDLFTH
ncbi:esterase-like activity of phytase-domain-containing protein [Cerioporus squamosus]|nr:esterase-like activity of phytase-domain-containing protein [Cerioporus squamosus]